MTAKTYYDGVWQDPADVRIPLSDRSYFFGDAIYEAMIGKNGVCYRERDHLCRLFRNLRAAGIPFYDTERLESVLEEAKTRTEGEPFFLYIQISRDSPTRTHVYADRAGTHLLIHAEPFSLPDPEKRLSLITLPDRRYDFCHIKTTNLLPNVFAAKEADVCGADEAVFVRGKTVTECSHSNVFIVRDGVLLTHPADRHILPGITRKRILSLAGDLGIPTAEKSFSAADLKSADTVLVSATSKFALKAELIDGKRVRTDDETADRIVAAIFRDFERETDV